MDEISSGIVVVSSGVTSTGLLVVQEGVLQIMNEGQAEEIGVADGGKAVVSQGGILYGCTVSADGTATVLSSGYARDVAVESGGLYVVSNGGSTIRSFIRSGGKQMVYANVRVASAFVEEGGELHIFSDALARTPVVSQGGAMYQWNGALSDRVQLHGALDVYASARASRATVFDSGRMAVLAAGSAYMPSISSGGVLEVSSGGEINSATIHSGGSVMVSAGGSSFNTQISGGAVVLEGETVPGGMNGGYMSGATVNSGGAMIVSGGAVAVKIKENGGCVDVEDGANVAFASNAFSDLALSNARATVHSGTTATGVTVNHGGKLEVFSGGTAAGIAENGGYIEFADGADVAFLSNTISELALDNASATVHSGTTVNGVAVGPGGRLDVFSGGKATGEMTFAVEAVVSAYDGAVFAFDISGLAPEAEARVNNLSIIEGAPIYTLTVSDTQANGAYTLAEGATGFSGTITVQNMLGDEIGTLTVGNSLITKKNVYTLNFGAETASDALILTVAQNELPTVSNIQASETKPTSQDVVITAEFADDVGLAQSLYRIGESGEWTDYVDGVVVTENTTVSFKAVDITGNESEIASYEVANIDRTDPVITLSADTETVVLQTPITATVDDGSTIQYRIGEFGLWKEYKEPIIASLNETYYFMAMDDAGNIGTNQITFGNIDTSGILLSTLWSQRGINPMGGNTTILFNEYTPLDPSVTPEAHCLTGCVNTASGQLIYYFIEKGWLDLPLTLKKSDEYTSKHKAAEEGGDPIVIEIKSDGSTPGTLSFAEINAMLSDYQLDSAEHAAALLYAIGVVLESKYSANSTGTSWNGAFFKRAGFEGGTMGGPYYGQYYWGDMDDEMQCTISDAGFEVLIENLEAGLPVGATYPGHAFVVDGYDRESDRFHVNFGWGGNQATRWYTRDEIHELNFEAFVYDLNPEYVETFTVVDARVYGTGTMIRAFEKAAGMIGDNTVAFDPSVAGKTVELLNHITLFDEVVTVKDFNMNVLVTKSDGGERGYGFYAEHIDVFEPTDPVTVLTFHASGGSLIVSTEKESNYAFQMEDGLSCTVDANGMLIYAGKTIEGTDAAAVLKALQESRSGNTEVSEDLLDPNGWSYNGSAGEDVFSLSNSSIAVGNVSLGDGDDVLTLTGHSRLYGTIDAGDGDDSITVDSASSISGDLSGKSKLNFVLAEREDHAIFTIKKSVSDLYSNATLSVDITNAEIGTYTLISAAPGATGISDLQNMVFTVTGSGVPDFTLSINGTSTSDWADLIYEDNSLKLQVKTEPGPVIPEYEFLINGEVLSVRKDFDPDAVFNTVTLTTEQLNSFEWLNLEEGVSIAVNGTALENGKCEFALAKIGEAEKIHVQIAQGDAAREFVINTLNTNLPPITVEGASQTPGDFFLSFFNTRSIIKTDKNGNIVYYRNEDAPDTRYGLWDFKAHQIDGKTYFSYHSAYSDPDVFVTTGHNPGERVIMDENYNEVARITAVATEKNGGDTALDGHEFLMLGEDHYIVLSYLQVEADNIPDVNQYTGEPIEHADKAVLVAAFIQEIDHGEVKFEWLSTDHPELYGMTVTDQVANANDFTNTDPDTYIDYVHLNAIVVDDDGNLVVSCRHLDSMIKIDRNGGTGNLLWALSGLGDDFGLTDEQKTSGQHYLRYMGNGFFSVFNNNNKEGVTKLFLYHLNEDESALSGNDGFRSWTVPGTTEFEPELPCPPHKTYACGSFQKIGEYGVAGWGWNLSGDELVTEFKLDDASQITFQLRSVYDPSAAFASYRIVKRLSSAPELAFTAEKASWSEVEASSGYVLSIGREDADNALRVAVSEASCDIFNLPNGEYAARVTENDFGVSSADSVLKIEDNLSPAAVASTANGIGDLFFAKASGTWDSIYFAQHAGSIHDWNGTNEMVSVNGRNRLADLFFGSDDANILCLTDDENGDGVFVDDEFTDLPECIESQQSRIARIDEIRAGAGDDIVDMTSNRIEYVGDGLAIRGGDGNDVIWANKGDNRLFGDAGNDRIVGASGNDVIAGGVGDDRMHGGGGEDVFAFCENWGTDTVQQLESGSVTLWFASGSEANWDEATLTYADGDNSVRVSGVAADKVTLKFGDDGSERFAALYGMGAFSDATTKRVFEESGKGILASL
jgi:autotransporter passenger strand-loop-strand repeat protein